MGREMNTEDLLKQGLTFLSISVVKNKAKARTVLSSDMKFLW